MGHPIFPPRRVNASPTRERTREKTKRRERERRKTRDCHVNRDE